MQEKLYKLQKKRTYNLERVSEETSYYEKRYPQYKNDVELVLDDCVVGLEVEVENCSPGAILLYDVWVLKEDHSLRNGCEFVSHPIKGNRIVYAINQLFENLNEAATFSPRTSIHVHVNVLDIAPEQIGSLILVYSVVEKLLYRFIGHERDKNNFAVPMYDAYCAPSILKALYHVPFEGVGMQENQRYLGLNVDSVRKFGSLEFRQMNGTRNKAKLINWINLLFCMKKYASEVDPEILKTQVAALNTESNYHVFINSVFGKFSYLLDQSNLQKDLEGNVSELKKILYENVFLIKLRMTNPKTTRWFGKLKLMEKQKDTMSMRFETSVQPRTARVRRAAAPQWIQDAVVRAELRIADEDLGILNDHRPPEGQ